MTRRKPKSGIMETVMTIIWALIIAGAFRTAFFQPFWIPSESMKENLLVGDYLFINKWTYGYSRFSCPFNACPITGRLWGAEPQRGDVVVFAHPVSGVMMVKRLIALPGERVQVRSGLVYIDDALATQLPDGEFADGHHLHRDGARRYTRLLAAALADGDRD